MSPSLFVDCLVILSLLLKLITSFLLLTLLAFPLQFTTFMFLYFHILFINKHQNCENNFMVCWIHHSQDLLGSPFCWIYRSHGLLNPHIHGLVGPLSHGLVVTRFLHLLPLLLSKHAGFTILMVCWICPSYGFLNSPFSRPPGLIIFKTITSIESVWYSDILKNLPPEMRGL